MRTLKYILLPVLGIIAGVLAFSAAAPYIHSLDRTGWNMESPQALFTYGSTWGAVNRIAFGALLCGPFAMALTIGRRVWWKVLIAAVLGTVLGGLINFVTDSSSDIVGIALTTVTNNQGLGSIVAMLIWCFFVPLGVSMAITLAIGPTNQRMRRAWYATRYAAIAAFCVQMIGGMMIPGDPENDAGNILISQIPVWRSIEIAVGLVLGLLILVADEVVRSGTIRLVQGKNEYRDWSLDNVVTRIGSAEDCEVPIFGHKGVQPVHATITSHQSGFSVEAHGPTLLNGQAVQSAMLRSTDTIQVGDAQLVFTSRDGGYFFAPRPVVPTIPVPSGPVSVAAPVSAPLYIAPAPPPGAMKTFIDAYGNRVTLPSGRYTIGRDMSNAICLQHDNAVSPRHAELQVTDTSVTVVDYATGFSTRVNGQPLTGQADLRVGDVVDFGSCRFTYVS